MVTVEIPPCIPPPPPPPLLSLGAVFFPMSITALPPPVESDPGVFTELVARMGVADVEFSELWSCDPESLEALPQ